MLAIPPNLWYNNICKEEINMLVQLQHLTKIKNRRKKDMARKRMVTRTITTKEVTALCLNIVTAEPHNETFIVPCNIEGDEKIMKYIRSKYDTETEKAVSVVDINETEQLYGMLEEDFVKLAHPINTADEDNTDKE